MIIRGQKRPNPDKIQAYDQRIGKLKRYIESAKVIAEGKESPFWTAIQDLIKDKLELIELRLADSDNIAKMSDQERLFILKERVDLNYLFNMVDDFEAELPDLVSKLSELEKERDEYRQRLSTAHT